MPAPNRPPIDPTTLPPAEKARILQYVNWANQTEAIVNNAEQRVAQHITQLAESKTNLDQLSAQIATLQTQVTDLQAANAALVLERDSGIQKYDALIVERNGLLDELITLRGTPSPTTTGGT